MSELINLYLQPGDKIDIEHTCVDQREHISVFVCYCSINDGKGVAVFNDNNGTVYLWKPSKTNPHGIVERVDSPNEEFLVNPYVRVYNPEIDKFRPVDSRSGTYIIMQGIKNDKA